MGRKMKYEKSKRGSFSYAKGWNLFLLEYLWQ